MISHLESWSAPDRPPRASRSCNKHILGLGQRIKKSMAASNITGYQFGTVGVSDGISMGTFGMSYSVRPCGMALCESSRTARR